MNHPSLTLVGPKPLLDGDRLKSAPGEIDRKMQELCGLLGKLKQLIPAEDAVDDDKKQVARNVKKLFVSAVKAGRASGDEPERLNMLRQWVAKASYTESVELLENWNL